MKVYTKDEWCYMPFHDYLWNVAAMDREALSLGISGIGQPEEILRSPSGIFKVFELQERIIRKRANLKALTDRAVNASMMSLVEEGE